MGRDGGGGGRGAGGEEGVRIKKKTGRIDVMFIVYIVHCTF